MTDERTPGDRAADGHPAEERLIAWLDEPGSPGGEAIEAHLAGCEACRRRVEAIRAVLAAVATEPETPDPATFAERRERLLEGLPDRPGRSRVPWRLAWVPLLAAAALAGILVLRAGRDPGPGPAGEPPVAAADVPAAVTAEAERAADEVFVAVVGEAPGDEETAAIGPSELAALEIVEETTAETGVDETAGYVGLAEEFAALPSEEQEAILSELETMTFDL